jgi:hypothetical protein
MVGGEMCRMCPSLDNLPLNYVVGLVVYKIGVVFTPAPSQGTLQENTTGLQPIKVLWVIEDPICKLSGTLEPNQVPK